MNDFFKVIFRPWLKIKELYEENISLKKEINDLENHCDFLHKEKNEDIRKKDEILETQKKMIDSLERKNLKLIDDALSHTCLEPAAEDVIKKIIKRGIGYYDYSKLPEAEKVQYYQGAQRLLKDTVLRNEANYYIADIVTEIAKQSKDFGEVRDLRHTILGVEQLMERLKNIENPLKNEDNLDPQADI